MDKFEEKMKKAGLSQAAIDAFRINYEQLVGGATGMVSRLTDFGIDVHFTVMPRSRSAFLCFMKKTSGRDDNVD